MNLHRLAVFLLLLGGCLGACGSDDSSSSSSTGTSSSNGGSQSNSGGGAGIPDLEPGGSNIHYPPLTGGSGGASGAAGGARDGGNGASGAAGSVGLSDAGQDDAPSGVFASPECNAFCQKAQDMCMAKCDRGFWCGPRVMGQCDAATRAYLQCVLDTAKWMCAGNGLMLDHRCAPDLAICR
jgi:hypothetical protein